jgi:uncharacterized Zn-finger protein
MNSRQIPILGIMLMNWLMGSKLATIHEEKKPFECKICYASFARKYTLKVHVEMVHEGKKPFNCTICAARFALKQQVKGHVESAHEGKKPFMCNFCDSCFSQKVNLHQFMKEREP